jgi:ATP-dependent Zn protease
MAVGRVSPNPEGNGRIVVNLPNDPDLISTLESNKVDIVVLPQSDDNVWVRALSTLLIPVLLLVVLFFVLRRAQNGPGHGHELWQVRGSGADGARKPRSPSVMWPALSRPSWN